jgi:hypothetical protein
VLVWASTSHGKLQPWELAAMGELQPWCSAVAVYNPGLMGFNAPYLWAATATDCYPISPMVALLAMAQPGLACRLPRLLGCLRNCGHAATDPAFAWHGLALADAS